MGLSLLLLAVPAIAAAQEQAPAPVPAPKAKLAADSPDKVICKTTPQIGSLVATTKVCRTRREWERMRDDLRGRGPVGNCAGSAQGGSCS